MSDSLQWIEPGRRFGFDDLVFWRRRGEAPFEAVAAGIDTIVVGPHASAAFPAELRPFISPGLTRRKQFDFSDVMTASLGRRWAEADPHVVYIENPLSRVVLDPNRARPADPIGALREFYARLARQRAGETTSFSGVDVIRPITFGGEDVIVEPADESGWRALGAALAVAAANGFDAYRGCCDRVLATVLAARRTGAPLRLISLHDTMNTKMRPDGAIVVERPESDRLPRWVNFGNKGDAQGEAEADPLTIGAAEMRRIARAWADAFGLDEARRATEITLNRPYKGAFESVHYGARLSALGEPSVGAVQAEFLRETLLGPAATAHLHQPGEDWPAVDAPHIGRIATALAVAGAELRQSAR